MKLSILTATYNREKLLKKLYNSIIKNSNNHNIEIEWLIMDDGSTDNTCKVIQDFIEDNKIKILYYKQVNQGKMSAINNLIENSTGDLIIECDSDDYFIDNAFNLIFQEYLNNKNSNIYALCFLKNNQNNQNMGQDFRNNITTMFDLYFKEGERGEKALVFYSKIRKQYKYELENNERFVTESRMYHKMDLKYKIRCVNKPIMVCEYQNSGYSKNINKQFIDNPNGYYKYFKEMFEHDTNKILFNKRLYLIKHFILFKYLTKTKYAYKNVTGFINKILYLILYIPGLLKISKKYHKQI